MTRKFSKAFILQYVALFLVGFIIINFITLYNSFPSTKNDDYKTKRSISKYGMTFFSSKVQKRVDNEKKIQQLDLHKNFQLIPPSFNNYTKQQSREIPYRYSDWRSSPDLPRRLTPCDHQLYTELLSTIDYFFRRHQISYIMADGSLLGSYAYHDILPWDDDADLLVPIRDRQRMNNLLPQELGDTIIISNVTDSYGNYDKVYFSWSSKAGAKNWSYPFIDIGYLGENSTHMWRVNCNNFSIEDSCMSKRDIFPLIYRPFGEIWLPAPREPIIIFESLRWTLLDKWYYAKNHSHKYERSMPSISGRAQPYQLYPYYPWVKRYCLKTYCIEQLITIYNNTNITIHILQFDKYRTELVFNSKLKNKTSLLR